MPSVNVEGDMAEEVAEEDGTKERRNGGNGGNTRNGWKEGVVVDESTVLLWREFGGSTQQCEESGCGGISGISGRGKRGGSETKYRTHVHGIYQYIMCTCIHS